jgi:hypothetical protein
MLVSRLPETEQTSRLHQSRTLISGPYCLAISAGSGSTRWPQFPAPGAVVRLPARTTTRLGGREHAAFPTVIGGPE